MNQQIPNHIPPRLPRTILRWYCKPDMVEDIEGDIQEDFNKRYIKSGARSARFYYILDVIRFFKPFAIKNLPKTQFYNPMFKNYFKTSVRSLARNKLFSAINILGLSISMSVCLLMISFITELNTYDAFHKNGDKIHRVITKNLTTQHSRPPFASTSGLAGKRISSEIPGIEATVMLNKRFGGDAQMGDKTIHLGGFWASKDFFKVFPSFELLQGNPQMALADPYSIVLTEEAALKMFGTTASMGKSIPLTPTENYKVTGIVKKPPHNSHFTFESLGSMITHENKTKLNAGTSYSSWRNFTSHYVYVLLEEKASTGLVSQELNRISEEENSKFENASINLELQAMLDITPGPELVNNIGKTMNADRLWMLGGLTLIVMLSAGFNYTNLSIARSLRRAKEVGARKVVGASKTQIFLQFIVESVVTSLIALIFAILIFYIIRPEFLNIDPQIQEATQLLTSPSLFSYFVIFAVFVGLMAGIFPSVLLSKLQAIQVLKGANSTRLFKRLNMKKVLLVVQFTLSLIFIISATISFKQYRYALEFDLGFETDNVLNVSLHGHDDDKAINTFSTIPEVTAISRSAIIPSVGSRFGTIVKYDDPLDSATLHYNIIDENYVPLMGHELLAGSNFRSNESQKQEESIIVNEQVLKRFDLGSPEQAIDKMIQVGADKENRLRIVGVVKDFHYATINDDIEPFAFRYIPDSYNHVNLKINTTDLISTMTKLEEAWEQVDEAHGLESSFYDEDIEAAYSEYSIMYTIVGFLAFIAISIAALGLLGMAVYTSETRLKEISIRKVLGATEMQLIKLLGGGFFWLLIISSVLAVPITYYLFDSVVLVDSANRIEIGVLEIVSGLLILFGIGLLTIGSQTWKAARTNPANSLRNE